MTVEAAVAAFESGELNCAQSILRAFQKTHPVSEEDIALARRLGGGRAEAGRCGALHAALQLAQQEPDRQRLCQDFIARAGSERCREIRRASQLSCGECVRLAATLLQGGEPNNRSTTQPPKDTPS